VGDLVGVGDFDGVGEGLEETTVTGSHCCPDVAADAETALNATADTPVRSMPPAIKLPATGRTRVKHMRDALPVLLVTAVERLFSVSCYIQCDAS
jgi:hypothetical protein